MFKQHTARLGVRQQLGVSAWNGLCNQHRLLICSPLVMRVERSEERKQTGNLLCCRKEAVCVSANHFRS